MSSLRNRIIKLAYNNKDLRSTLLPLVTDKQSANNPILEAVLDLIPYREHQDLYTLMEAQDLEAMDWFFEHHRIKNHPAVRKFMQTQGY